MEVCENVVTVYADIFYFLHLKLSTGKVWSTRGGQKIAGWTDPIAAQDDSYSCIACSCSEEGTLC